MSDEANGAVGQEDWLEGLDDLDDLDEEFDPLYVDDAVIDQENMDDDNPLDTVDFPTMRNMPDAYRPLKSRYTPERLGGAEEAVLSLIDHNPGRRQALLAIIGWCEGGCLNSELTARVDELQGDNRSVYSSTTLCRMLQRAGALTLEMPEVAEEREDVAEGVEYLEIKERVDPTWRSTEEALSVYAKHYEGGQFRDLVLDRDSTYLAVYVAVLEALEEEPRSLRFIEGLTDAFPVVRKPRRFGQHFIDILERADAIAWKDRAWHITDLGRRMLPEAQRQAKED